MLPISPFERLAKKSGVKRISKDALEELAEIITDRGLHLAEGAVKISKHAGKNTVQESDVVFVLKK